MERARLSLTSANRINWDRFPMRLYQLGKKLFWDPANLNMERDRKDWEALPEQVREMLLQLTVLFGAGEEAVTWDLSPLLSVLTREGRLEEQMYLEQFLFEESKHTEAFTRILDFMAPGKDNGRFIDSNPSYRRIFYVELPNSMNVLLTDQTPEAQIRAATTYMMIVEGVLAETAYHGYVTTLEGMKVMSTLLEMIRNVMRDESRHIAFGTYLISRLVAEYGEPAFEAFNKRLSELAPLAMGVVEAFFKEAQGPSLVQPEEYVNYAMSQFRNRYTVIERARRMTVEQVYAMGLREMGVVTSSS